MLGIETAVLEFFQSIHLPVLNEVMIFFSFLANHGEIWIAVGIVFLCIPKYRKFGLMMLIALLLLQVVGNWGLKPLIGRERPYVVYPSVPMLVPKLNEYSFPSGHTGASFAGVTVLFILRRVWPRRANSILAWCGLAVASIIVISRLYLFMHWPTDILGGVVLGILCGIAAGRIVLGSWEFLIIRRNGQCG